MFDTCCERLHHAATHHEGREDTIHRGGAGRRRFRWLATEVVLGSLLLALSATPAGAQSVLHVPADFPTIQAAINAAVDGDTVLVAQGTYAENVSFLGKNVTLASETGPNATTLDANSGTAVQMGPGGVLNGFTITNAAAFFGAGVAVTGAGSVIRGNIFERNVAFVGGVGSGIGGNNASPTIELNVFRNNTCDDQYIAGVVVFVNSSSPIIQNNVFADNPCRAINMTLPSDAAPVVVNNTIVGNLVGIRVDGRVPSLGQIYRNNIVVGNGAGLAVDFGNPPTWDHNLVFGNGANYSGLADQTGLSGNISADPLFVDSVAKDFHLQSASPAVDAGLNLLAPLVDIDGDPRPLDGDGDGLATVDMGVDEVRPVTRVAIDIKPGSSANPINLSSRGVIPVAILTSDSFDATAVDPGTICFGDDDNPSQRDCTEAQGRGHTTDVNGDGRPDLLLHYEVGATGIDSGDTTACLTGKTFAGVSIEGCDSIKTL